MARFLLAILLGAFAWSSVSAADDFHQYILPKSRMAVTINVPTVVAAPIGQSAGNPAYTLANGLRETAKLLGLDPKTQMERVWVVYSEDYPKNTLIFLRCKFDPDRMKARFQDAARQKMQGARATTEGSKIVLAIDVPKVVQAIPGMSESLHLCVAGPELIAASFDRTTLLDALDLRHVKVGQAPAPVIALLSKLDMAAGVSFVAEPTASMTSPNASLAGTKQIVGSIGLDDGLHVRCAIQVNDPIAAQNMASQFSQGLDQFRSLLPSLTQAQGDPQIVGWLNRALAAMKVDAKSDSVEITLEMKSEPPAKAK